MSLETLHLAHLPDTHMVHVALFKDVSNAAFLHQQLLSGNTDFEYAFIDASVIVSRIQALSAVFRAVNDSIENRLRSRNVHSEIVFSLSPNNNIAESFRRFGITPTTTNLLVVKMVDSSSSSPASPESIAAHLAEHVQGTQVEFSDDVLLGMTDVARVRKIYKLNVAGGGKKVVNGNAGGNVNERKELEVGVLGAMALRGVS